MRTWGAQVLSRRIRTPYIGSGIKFYLRFGRSRGQLIDLMHAAMEKNDFLILHDEFVEKNSNPMSWEETKIIIESKDELLYKLGRRPEDLEVYKVTCDKMKEDYVSVSEFLKIDKFGFDKEVDQETGKLQAGEWRMKEWGRLIFIEHMTRRLTPPCPHLMTIHSDAFEFWYFEEGKIGRGAKR